MNHRDADHRALWREVAGYDPAELGLEAGTYCEQLPSATPRVVDALTSRRAYIEGVRAGRLSAFCWGLLIGGAVVFGAVRLGFGA